MEEKMIIARNFLKSDVPREPKLSTYLLYLTIIYNLCWILLFLLYLLRNEENLVTKCPDLVQFNYLIILFCIICLFKHLLINFVIKTCEIDMLNTLFCNLIISGLFAVSNVVIVISQLKDDYSDEFCRRIIISDIVLLSLESCFIILVLILVAIIIILKYFKK